MMTSSSTAFWTSSAVPRTLSGPGWFWARVSTMKAWLAGTSSPVPALPSGPRVRSGSSSFSFEPKSCVDAPARPFIVIAAVAVGAAASFVPFVPQVELTAELPVVHPPELLAGGYRKKYLRALSRLTALTRGRQ